ncbi:MAG: hypothetical protein ACF8GE_04300 [Phycisphaerales bacterium JB043]
MSELDVTNLADDAWVIIREYDHWKLYERAGEYVADIDYQALPFRGSNSATPNITKDAEVWREFVRSIDNYIKNLGIKREDTIYRVAFPKLPDPIIITGSDQRHFKLARIHLIFHPHQQVRFNQVDQLCYMQVSQPGKKLSRLYISKSNVYLHSHIFRSRRVILTRCYLPSPQPTERKIKKWKFIQCTFNGLTTCEFRKCRFSNCEIGQGVGSEVRFKDSSLIACKGLWENMYADVYEAGAETARYWSVKVDKWLPWERIKNVGKMRIFTASSVAIVGLLIYHSIVDWYNNPFRQFAHRMISRFEEIQPIISVHDPPPLEASRYLVFLLVALLMLALAATLYGWRCPEIVKQFTEEKWRFELKRSPLPYRAANWSRFWSRLLIVLLYFVGGLYTLLYTGTHAVSAVDNWWQSSTAVEQSDQAQTDIVDGAQVDTSNND